MRGGRAHRHHQIGGIFDPEYRAIRQRHVADGSAAQRSGNALLWHPDAPDGLIPLGELIDPAL